MMQDHELLRAYWRHGSEQAFSELVRRYVGLVFSTARRQVRDAVLAEDVSQTVFCLLARKARSVSAKPTLAGWLYRATCFCAARVNRRELRRRKYEQEAQAMRSSDSKDHDVWEQLSPMLDAALATLRERDQAAILLRFFQQKPMREVGLALGISEAAAKMRIARSVEQLRQFFAQRGVACSIAGLSAVLGERSVEATPANLPSKLSRSASAAAGVHGLSILETLLVVGRLNLNSVVLGGSITLLCALLCWHFSAPWRRAPHKVNVAERTEPPSGRSVAPPKVLPVRQRSDPSALAEQIDLSDAIARLRAALYATNNSTVPGAAVVEAVDHFGSQRRVAFTVLREVAAKHDQTRLPTDPRELAPRRAICAMGFLGKSVPEARIWLWRLYDQQPDTKSDSVAYLALRALEHIGFQPEDIPKLADNVLSSTPTPIAYAETLRPPVDAAEARDLTGNAFVKSQAAGWLAEIIEQNPFDSLPYFPSVQTLLAHRNEDVRFWSACALLESEGAQNPTIIQEISTGLTNGSQERIAWASKLFANMGEAAKPIVPALLQAAETSAGNARDWAYLSIGKIQPDLRMKVPKVDQALLNDQDNQALLARLNSDTYTTDDLIGMLQDPGGVAVAAKLLGKMFPAPTNVLPALFQALTNNPNIASRDAILTCIRKLDPTAALAPDDVRWIWEDLRKRQASPKDHDTMRTLFSEGDVSDLAWATRPGFQACAHRLALQDPTAYDILIPAVLKRAPSWRNLLPTH